MVVVFLLIITSSTVSIGPKPSSGEVEIIGESIMLAKQEESLDLWRDFGLPDPVEVGGLAFIEGICDLTISTFPGE